MNFTEVENPRENAAFIYKWGASHIKESGNYYLFIQPVAFGWRVTLLRKGELIYDLDLCAGDNKDHIRSLYCMVETILNQTEEEDLPKLLEDFPVHQIKPYFNDGNFMFQIGRLLGEKLNENPDNMAKTEIDMKELIAGRKRSFNV